LWNVLVVISSIAVLGFAMRLLWPARRDAALGVGQLTAYAAFLIVASASPFAVTLLLRRVDAPPPVAGAPRRSALLSPVTACVVLSIVLALLAALIYGTGREFVANSEQNRLEAIATFKASAVTAWIADARNDIRVWSSSPHFFRAMEDWRDGGPRDTQARQRLLDFLWLLSKTSHYAEVGVRDTMTGSLLLTTRGDVDSPLERHEAVSAAGSPSPLLEVIRHDATGGLGTRPFLGYFAAVTLPRSGDKLVMDVAIDLEHELFPLVDQRPASTANNTSEVLLMSRAGNGMVILNEADSRHQAQPSGGVEDTSSTGIHARLARGAIGFMRGDDDRGRPVLAYAQPVNGTSWVLVAKIDEAEAFSELNQIALLGAALAGALLLLAAWWWVEHRRQLAVEDDYQFDRAAQGQRLAELSRRVVSVQEEERRRLASELHDRTAANLATINLNLKSIARSVPVHSADADALMEETRELLADTVVSIREFCGDLRPSILDYAGLQQALENFVDRFKRRTGLLGEVDHAGFTGRCPPEIESVLFRIVQEALLNCTKHAQAHMVRVVLRGDSRHLTLTVEDDGVGFDQSALALAGSNAGSGLLNMKERAAFAGGSLSIESGPGRGTRITVEI
jgi:signal transduction histidine kinase